MCNLIVLILNDKHISHYKLITILSDLHNNFIFINLLVCNQSQQLSMLNFFSREMTTHKSLELVKLRIEPKFILVQLLL